MAHALVMRVSVCLSVCTVTMANAVRCVQEQSTLSPLPLVVQPSELQPPRPPVHMTRWNVATSSDTEQCKHVCSTCLWFILQITQVLVYTTDNTSTAQLGMCEHCKEEQSKN